MNWYKININKSLDMEKAALRGMINQVASENLANQIYYNIGKSSSSFHTYDFNRHASQVDQEIGKLRMTDPERQKLRGMVKSIFDQKNANAQLRAQNATRTNAQTAQAPAAQANNVPNSNTPVQGANTPAQQAAPPAVAQ